ncbi:MAG: PASTA domain-containing protein, partial [Clostridia bacterium]|nr:PASTA domain-containing protein [Clostridia bacterium]
FGIARFSYSDTKTMTDSAIGSVHYISPEQARGDTTDNKADIYSVGVVMYEMLTGQLPFQSDNSVSVALMQLQTDPKNPRELNSSIPVGLEQIVMHAMQKNTKDRYQSAAEMLLDIEEFKRNPTIRFQQSYFVDTDPTKFVTNKPAAAPIKTKPAEADSNRVSAPVNDEEDYDEGEDSGRSKRSLIAIGVGIGLLVVAVVVFGILYFFTDLFQKNSLVVPNFVDKNYAEEIKDNPDYDHFNIKVVEIANSHYTAGNVFHQSPSSGQVLKNPDTEITLSVASTDVKLVVTDVYGMRYQLAVDTLESKGFTVNHLPMLSTTEEFGTVIKTEPERNTEVEAGSVITIYYASDEDLITVPVVEDLDVETAQALIESVKLVFDTNITEENSDKPAGTVISQTPAGEQKVYPGSTVSVVVSNGIPASAVAEVPIILPSSGSRGRFEVFVNNEIFTEKTLLCDGNPYVFKIEGSGADASVKIYVDNKQYYSCTVDFTATPAVVSEGSYSSSAIISTRKQLPNVQGLSLSVAEKRLNDQGFFKIEIKGQTVYTDAEDGLVLSQSPSPSSSSIIGMTTTYPVDTEITLVVGQKDGV